MAEENRVEFKWGKRRGGVAGKKELQYYESFTFNGTEYSLYDSVFMYPENVDDTLPNIGKIVKMWERPDKGKMVKVVWFFHPCEVSNYLGDEEVLEKELFLASGEGAGLVNVKPLDTISGKCNVVCTSKDSRNPQPSSENIRTADFTFSRTFDVKHCKIMNVIGERIAGVEGKFLLNKAVDSSVGSKLDPKVDAQLGDVGRTGSKFSKGLINQVRRQKVDNPMKVRDEKNKNKEHKSTRDPQCIDTTKDSFFQAFKTRDPQCIDTTKDSFFQAFETHDPQCIDTTKYSVQAFNASGDRRKFAKNPNESENRQPMKHSEKIMKQAIGKLPETYHRPSSNVESKIDPKKRERPEADRSKWFKRLPWYEQMRNAHDDGALILLQNLDPSYTSAEVEVIIRKAFGESCTAKMIQHTAFSSPDSGEALVVFKTRELAEFVLAKLDKDCLLLSNGRPLVGRRATPTFAGKKTSFHGHLVIDRLKLQMQREMKEAVSTSHSAQPNSIEFDMSMDWCLLQEKFDLVWKNLHERQRQEFKKLKTDLKSR